MATIFPAANASTKATKCSVTATAATGSVARERISRLRTSAISAYSKLMPYRHTAIRNQNRDITEKAEYQHYTQLYWHIFRDWGGPERLGMSAQIDHLMIPTLRLVALDELIDQRC